MKDDLIEMARAILGIAFIVAIGAILTWVTR